LCVKTVYCNTDGVVGNKKPVKLSGWVRYSSTSTAITVQYIEQDGEGSGAVLALHLLRGTKKETPKRRNSRQPICIPEFETEISQIWSRINQPQYLVGSLRVSPYNLQRSFSWMLQLLIGHYSKIVLCHQIQSERAWKSSSVPSRECGRTKKQEHDHSHIQNSCLNPSDGFLCFVYTSVHRASNCRTIRE
jgi:hypothetical protein